MVSIPAAVQFASLFAGKSPSSTYLVSQGSRACWNEGFDGLYKSSILGDLVVV